MFERVMTLIHYYFVLLSVILFFFSRTEFKTQIIESALLLKICTSDVHVKLRNDLTKIKW